MPKLTLLELAMVESQRCSGIQLTENALRCAMMFTRVNRKLGILEAEGVLDAIRYLAFQLGTNIDRSRIGLYGWSYGGFLTIATMTSQTVSGVD